MAKRFTDTTKWKDEWFQALPTKYKLFWCYILDECDNAGIWKPNLGLAEYQLSEKFDANEVKMVLGKRIEVLDSGYWFIRKFIDFQYGELNETSKPHAAVLAILKRNKIGYTKGIHTPKEKDKDKDKDNTPPKDEKFNSEIAKILHKPYAKGKDRGADGAGQDVDMIVYQLKAGGWDNTKIRDQATAMRAVYSKEEWPLPSNSARILNQLLENDWVERLKSDDPERKAEQISKAKKDAKPYTPQLDEIGVSAPGSLG